jgi:hypothetical protein
MVRHFRLFFQSRKRRRRHAAIVTKNLVEYVFVALLWLVPDRRIERGWRKGRNPITAFAG